MRISLAAVALALVSLAHTPAVAAQELPGLGAQPKPETPARSVEVESSPAPTTVLHFFAWIDQREAEWAKARSEGVRVAKEAFDAAGIVLPEPTLNVRQLEATAAGQETERPTPAAAPALELDISPDTHLDREVAEDRAEAGQGDDLLDPRARRE